MLQRIVEEKKKEVAEQKEQFPLFQLLKRLSSGEEALRDGGHAFKKALQKPGISLIAEVKKASPSKGVFRTDFDPAGLATAYEAHGARAISVLTDKKFFQGSAADLKRVKSTVALPVLRKEFIIDPYQIFETALMGADALLLIAAILQKEALQVFVQIARELSLDVLVEVRQREELEMALESGAEIIGINNRNLHTFQTDLCTTLKLAEYIPETHLLVSESGISNRQDLRLLAQAGVNAILVGEALVTSRCLEDKVRELAGGTGNGLD